MLARRASCSSRISCVRLSVRIETATLVTSGMRLTPASISTASESPNHRSVVTLRAVPDGGDPVTVSGTLTGADQVEKLVEINGRSFDIRAEGHVVLFEYTDRPGAMGTVGTLLGESDVNIQAAQMSQTRYHNASVMLLRVDQAVPDGVLAPIGRALGARTTRSIRFGLPADRPSG